MLTLLFGIIGFGIMVFVHELGHFLAAKRLGIQVEAFSLGWGKRLVGFTYRGTEYRLSLIPFGGYCKMKGEIPLGLSRSAEPQPAEEGAFYAAPAWKRVVVAASGPLANVLFAIVVLTAIWWIGFRVYSDDNRIVLASEYSLDPFPGPPPAARAGLKTGDRVLAIGDRPMRNFQDLLETVSTAPGKKLQFIVERDGLTLSIPVEPELDRESGAGRIGIYSWRDPVIDRVEKGSAAAVAGLAPGDRLLSVNGAPVRHLIDLFQELRGRPAVLTLRTMRDSGEVELRMVMRYSEQGAPDLGFSFRLNAYPSPRLGPAAALGKGLGDTWNTLVLTVKGLGLLFRGVSLRKAVAGPLRITYYVGSVASAGFSQGFSQGLVSYFRFLCMLSIVLFLMNLLPIPGLDGGQSVVFLLEIARRRPVSPKVIARIQVVSFSILLLVAVAVTASDILFFMGR